jgi:hypothetical protein
MLGLVPGIHALSFVDGRAKPGQDEFRDQTID